jgi:aldehyde:ferredoxin oxidoreductase
MMCYGSHGRYADVDLSSGVVRTCEIPDLWRDRFVGGRGIGARILTEELPTRVDALAPENVLVFATGPFQGTGIAGASRMAVLAVSPVTGRVSDSFVGGFLPHEFGRSGFDGLILRGRARRPVYLVVQDGRIEILDAGHLWGKDVLETDRALKARHPGVRTATIGTAGERMIPYATIMVDVNRAAGRPGFGAVMGSKNLKAVVVKGGIEKPVFDPPRFIQLRNDFAAWLITDPATQKRKTLGTAKGVLELNGLGILPTRNFQESTFDGAEAISGERLAATLLVGRDTCAGCPVACKRVVEGSFSGEPILRAYGGMEYETIGAFGSLCGIDDLEAIALASQSCNRYGLDTITTGVAIAAAMEATERGILEDAGVAWGDGAAVNRLVGQIVRREGLGRLLAGGMPALEAEWGSEFVLHVKGQAVPLHDPRGKRGMGISYATSPRGATHMEGFDDEMLVGVTDAQTRFGVPDGEAWQGWTGKPELCVRYENLMSFTNSLVLCAFVSMSKAAGPYDPYGRIGALYEALTGETIDAREMLRVGARNYGLLDDLAARLGGPGTDGLPPRFWQPIPAGPCAGQRIDEPSLQEGIAAYRALRASEER